jgi:TonB family protein
VSRKLDGLFNVEQLALVESLVTGYVGLNQYEDAEREQQYAVRLAENSYGRYDPRLIPLLERGADWLEDSGRFIAARQTYARALEIARKAGGDKDPRMITPLRGIARMYRMEYIYGVEPVGPVVGVNSPQASGSVYGATTAPTTADAPGLLNEAGEDALKLALVVIDAHPEIAPAQRGDTLIDLGDWYMVAAKPRDAMRTYKDAWHALAAPGAKGTAALDAPQLIIYRPPSSSRRNPTVDPEEYTEGFVEVQFVVTPEGRVKDPTIATSDVTDTVGKSVVTAIRRARYRPRFVDGAPALTSGVRHRQAVFVRAPKSSA